MSSTHQRAVLGYPDPKQYALFVGFAAYEELSKSEALNLILRDYFQRLPPEKRAVYIAAAKEKEVKQLPDAGKVSWPV